MNMRQVQTIVRRTRVVLCAALFLAAVGPRRAGARAADVRTGLDVLVETEFRALRGKRIGLITNQTGRSRTGVSNIELFSKAPGVVLAALFSPEHGLKGLVEEGRISSDTLKLADGRIVPLFSLYGSTDAPTSEMLAGLDALVFDMQDIGARPYTYAATMSRAMESAAAAGLEYFVLDRPDPIDGRTVEGAVRAPALKHFIAYLPVATRHGLTMGELARAHAALAGLDVRLRVVAMKGWERKLWYDETGLPWTKPSPNMPDLASAALYPGLAGFDFSNVSVGRGTPRPFLWVGAPWLDARALLRRLEKASLAGVRFSVQDYVPSKSLYAGEACRGVAIEVSDRGRVRSLRVFAHLAAALRDIHPKEFRFDWKYTPMLVGTEEFRTLYESGADAGRMIEVFDAGARSFEKDRTPYLLY